MHPRKTKAKRILGLLAATGAVAFMATAAGITLHADLAQEPNVRQWLYITLPAALVGAAFGAGVGFATLGSMLFMTDEELAAEGDEQS